MAENGLLKGLKGLIFEDETPAKPKAPVPAVKASTSPIPTTVIPTPTPIPTAFASTAAPAETADADTLALFRGAVFTPNINGHASHYMKFEQMWKALNKPADFAVVLGALNVTDASITLESVVGDFKAHLAQLDAAAAQADTEITGVGNNDLAVIQQAVDSLRANNDAAQAEIERHQHETAERNAKLSELTTQEANVKNATAQAQQRAVIAQNTVRGELIAMQSILKV